MTDYRIIQAQALHWEIEALRKLGAHRATLNVRRRRAAELLEERARELLARRDALGWTDLFAALTYWGEAGDPQRANDLLALGDQHVLDHAEGAERLRHELAELRKWLAALRVVPTLRAFARPLLPLWSEAA